MNREQSKQKEKQTSESPAFCDFGECSWYLGFLQPHSRTQELSPERGAHNGGGLKGVHSGVRSDIQGGSSGHQKDSSVKEAEK